MSGYCAGVDGGGTITKVLVADGQRRVVCHETGESINPFGVGMEAAKRNLMAIFDRIEANHGIREYESIFVGHSALSGPGDQAFTDLFLSDIRAKRKRCDSDAHIALACLPERPCLIVISGTGSIFLSMDERGKETVLGGYGNILGDQASAYHLGIQGIRAALKAAEGWGPPTVLADAVREHYSIDEFRDLIPIVHAEGAPKSLVAGFAVKVSEAAAAGDPVAAELLQNCIDDLYAQTVALAAHMPGPPRMIGLHGGVLRNCKFVCEGLQKKLSARYPGTSVGLTEIPAEQGALMLSYRTAPR